MVVRSSLARRIGTSIFNIVCVVVQLVVTYFLTNVIPMPDLLYDPSNPRYIGPRPAPEPLYVMILTLWVSPLLWLIVVHLLVIRWQPVKLLTVIWAWFQAVALTIFVTGLFRFFLPEPRPFFTTVCRPRTEVPAYLFRDKMCTAVFERRDLQSFPSGHSSSVVSSWVFVILVGLVGSGAIYSDRRMERMPVHKNALWKLTVFVLPALVVPIYVCSERIRSGNHTWYQVLFGAFIGIAVALLVFYTMDRTCITREGQDQIATANDDDVRPDEAV